MAVTPPQLITTDVSDPPNRGQDQSVFTPKMDAFLAAFDPLKTEFNDLADWSESTANLVEGWANDADASATAAAGSASDAAGSAIDAATSAASALTAPGTNATSTTSLTPGIGSKSFTLAQTGKSFVVGQFVTIADSTSPTTKWLNGAITAFNSGTGAITVEAISYRGTSGSSWVITASAPAEARKVTTSIINSYSVAGFATTPQLPSLNAKRTLSGAMTANTLKSFLNISGMPSRIASLKIYKADTTSNTMRVVVTIDGQVTPAFDFTSAASVLNQNGCCLAGAPNQSSITSSWASEITSNNSIDVSVASNNTETDKFYIEIIYNLE